MRNRKGLVQIEVTHVGPDDCRISESDLSIHVSSVHVNLAAMLVDERCDLAYRRFEDPMR